jgi:hypothetical protein
MGWIWALAVVGSLIGAGAIADRRRYRGLPVPPELTGRARRHEVRLQRARMAHLQASIRYSPFTGGDSAGGAAGAGVGGDAGGGY